MSAVRVTKQQLRPFFTPKTLAEYLSVSEPTVRCSLTAAFRRTGWRVYAGSTRTMSTPTSPATGTAGHDAFDRLPGGDRVRKDHRESPTKRVNPSGKVVWVARYTGPDGKRRSAGTFSLKRQAQDAINRVYETPTTPEAVGANLERWVTRHPRSERTNRTNVHRIRRVLAVKLEGPELRDWLLRDLRRRHVNDPVDHMLSVQRRAPTGAINILRALSAMCEDAITDELCDVNPFKGVRVRASDPRAV